MPIAMSVSIMTEFEREVLDRLAANGHNTALVAAANAFTRASMVPKYSYNFDWLGRPIIQYPQDIVAMQELIWLVKPDLIIETGIAHGGSLIFSASLLALLDYCEAVERSTVLDPAAPRRRVLGLDIDIRAHNRAAIEAHPMAHRIDMIQGSSIDPEIIQRGTRHRAGLPTGAGLPRLQPHPRPRPRRAQRLRPVGHPWQLLRRLRHHHRRPAGRHVLRPPLGTGRRPQDRRPEYLKTHTEFEIDKQIDHKLLISVAPDGYLRRIER